MRRVKGAFGVARMTTDRGGRDDSGRGARAADEEEVGRVMR